MRKAPTSSQEVDEAVSSLPEKVDAHQKKKPKCAATKKHEAINHNTEKSKGDQPQQSQSEFDANGASTTVPSLEGHARAQLL